MPRRSWPRAQVITVPAMMRQPTVSRLEDGAAGWAHPARGR
jgi:hypothetical protein